MVVTADAFLGYFRTAASSIFGEAVLSTLPLYFIEERDIVRDEALRVICDPENELPPRDLVYNLTAVIDIDETMLSARPNDAFYALNSLKRSDDNLVYVFRPLLLEFLSAIKRHIQTCEVIVWTAGTAEHARNAIGAITNGGRSNFFDFVIAKGAWAPFRTSIFKPSELLGLTRFESCVLFDNSDVSAAGFIRRGVVVPSFVPLTSHDDMILAYAFSVLFLVANVINMEDAEMIVKSRASSPSCAGSPARFLTTASPSSSVIFAYARDVHRSYKSNVETCPLVTYALSQHPFVSLRKLGEDDEIYNFTLNAVTCDDETLCNILKRLERIPIAPNVSPLKSVLCECFCCFAIVPVFEIQQISTTSFEDASPKRE